MRFNLNSVGLGAALALCLTNTALAQTGLPASQPNLLQIFREEVKVGHAAEHERVEMGWPAAYAKVKSPHYYLALVSMTGVPEAWFISPFESHEAAEASMKLDRSDPALAAELARLSRADSEHLNSARAIHAIARKDLSYGEYPDISKQRFWEITTMRVRPGREGDFAAAAKAYGAAVGRSNTPMSFRVYQVVAGMVTPTYLIFSSLPSYGAFDKMMANDEAVMKAFNDADQKVFQKFFSEVLINSDTQRFELNPHMSYVSPEVRAADPDFWMPKKKPVKKTTAPQVEAKPKAPGLR